MAETYRADTTRDTSLKFDEMSVSSYSENLNGLSLHERKAFRVILAVR